MDNTQVIELVLIEGEQGAGELFVLDWEFDISSNKILYFKLFHLRDWMKGLREHFTYIAPKGDLVLYSRDDSGYISTTANLRSVAENGNYYDEFGRAYNKSPENLSLLDLKMQLISVELLERLSDEEIIATIREGRQFNA